MQFDPNKVPDEEDETLEDQQDKQDDIHGKKMCFDLIKMPWYGDEISDPLKRESHRFITDYADFLSLMIWVVVVHANCSKSVEATIYTYWGSKTTARLRDEEEKKQQRRISRREMFIMTHKERDGSYMNDDARVVREAIAIIESQGGTSKEISVTGSLAQVLGKEHSGRVRGLGFGPCQTEIVRKTTQSNSGREITELKVVATEQKAEITELKAAAAEHKAETAEDKAKIQTMENLVKYIIQQQGHTLPPEIDAQLKSLGNGAK
ncbi:hypothetical protein Ahy_A04g017055 [Arachis hypogaea]|uniref:Uncharacterized protein n=1 Tax=Arachis hypogaea TaxID=3818 RepID=A0A445D9T3_ARAHY|nr:hypothetical protein Ahy_A04g017055 [Arachis hypogaea]